MVKPAPTREYAEHRLLKLRDDQLSLRMAIIVSWREAGAPRAQRDGADDWYHAYAWARVQREENGRPTEAGLFAAMWKDHEGRITEAEHWLALFQITTQATG